jgi:Glycosyl hydrolases family 39
VAGISKAKPVKPVKSAVQSARLTWKLPRPGIYRVIAAPTGTALGRTGQAVFCVFPGERPKSNSPRIGIHGWTNPSSPNSALQAAAYLGAGGFRLHDFRSFVQWYEAEPTAGQFVWFDRDVDDLARRGYRLMGTLCRPPLWAGRDGEQNIRHHNWTSSPPRAGEEWDRYVEAVTHHYRGKVGAWEVWNEPWSKNFWTGTPAEYAELVARTRRVIKAADPGALVIGGCFSPAFPQFTQGVLRAGGLEAMDVVSYHDYLEPGKVAEPGDGGEPAFYQAAVTLRDEIRRRGGRQPLWCSETGCKCPSFYSWLPKQNPLGSGRVAVGTLVKGLTLLTAAGVERTYYYQMGGVDSGQGYLSRMLNAAYTLLDYDGSPKPTLPALAQVIAMLGDATEPADLSNPALRAYVFRRLGAPQGSRFVAVAWARGAEPVSLEPESEGSVRVMDALAAPVSGPVIVDDRPIYLLADSREALARALGASFSRGARKP